MDTRDLIGTAKGIVMERYKLTEDQAFGCSCATAKPATASCKT